MPNLLHHCYKLGQHLLQSATAFIITKLDNFITKWHNYYNVLFNTMLKTNVIETLCKEINCAEGSLSL